MVTAFQIDNLSSGYEKSLIFNRLNVVIPKGKITTIIGPNGCGKSTLLKTIGRILKKEHGEIYLHNQNMDDLSTKEIAKQLAILPQSPSAPIQLKVEELVSYGRYPHRKILIAYQKRIWRLLSGRWRLPIQLSIDSGS